MKKLLLALAMASAMAAAAHARNPRIDNCTVSASTEHQINLRTAPNGKIIRTIEDPQIADVYDRKGKWVFVTMAMALDDPHQMSGWIGAKFLRDCGLPNG
jgi:hypothetical protein